MRQPIGIMAAAFLLVSCATPQPAATAFPVPTLDTIKTASLETLVVPNKTATGTSTSTLRAFATDPSVKFRLSVLVDGTSEQVTREEAELSSRKLTAS